MTGAHAILILTKNTTLVILLVRMLMVARANRIGSEYMKKGHVRDLSKAKILESSRMFINV